MLAGRTMQPAANTLEQQELLLAESAHDLRTPVAALRALAETALQNPSLRTELLPRTVDLAQRMGNIINDLLTRARLAAGVEQLDLQQVRLDQLVAGVVENTPTNGARITLDTTESIVSADPTLVQRAVGNLLDNALRHGRAPGQAAVIAVSVADGRITVADQGPGLREPLKATPFNRTGSSTTGLGLSIVRWIAAAHGGTLQVHNAPRGGAVFQLSLGLSNRERVVRR
jgi:signal transduction histidine kinase